MPHKDYYITTPLYYVNASPHIGHAYTNVLCDTFARYRRFRGQKVFFLTGTDEHGTKIEKAARDHGKDPRTYVDEMVPKFKDLWSRLGISYDHFIRTTDEEHKRVVRHVLESLEKKGDIYKDSYTGWYCTPCESFWTKLQLKEGKCPDCGRDVQALAEENYFFKLSKYQDWLIGYIHEHPDFVRPEIRRNEILGFLRQPLEDLCITRPRTRLAWGIDYPGSPDHVVYVWFDALINYVTAAGYSIAPEKFKKLWPADVHVVGKDILRQHAVYWPIMLKSCEIDIPKTVMAHGWWTLAGAKVSKSRGNVVDPVLLTQKYGVDAFRYFLLREVTIGFDGAFSEDLLAERYTSDLANDLGNLWFRLASMLEKNFQSQVPPRVRPPAGDPLLDLCLDLWGPVTQAMDQYDPRAALEKIWAVIVRANQYVEENKPWALAKDPAKRDDLAHVLYVLSEAVAHVAVLLSFLLPATASQITSRIGLPEVVSIKDEGQFSKLLLKSGTAITRGEALFPRLDEVKEKA